MSMTLHVKYIRKCTDPVGYSIGAEEMIHSPCKKLLCNVSERNGSTHCCCGCHYSDKSGLLINILPLAKQGKT